MAGQADGLDARFAWYALACRGRAQFSGGLRFAAPTLQVAHRVDARLLDRHRVNREIDRQERKEREGSRRSRLHAGERPLHVVIDMRARLSSRFSCLFPLRSSRSLR